jgi:hypothetical protein
MTSAWPGGCTACCCWCLTACISHHAISHGSEPKGVYCPHLKTLAYCQPSGDVAVDTASSQPRWRASLGARPSATGLPSSLLQPGRSSRPGAALRSVVNSPQSDSRLKVMCAACRWQVVGRFAIL